MKFRTNEWKSLAILLENGIGLEEALSLSFRNCDEIIEILNNGGNISEVKGIDKSFCYYLRFFSSVASMEDAIATSLRLYELRRSIIIVIIRQSVYPLLLFCMSFILAFFFLSVIYPQLLQVTQSQPSFLPVLVLNLIRFIFFFFVITLFLLIAVLLFLKGNADARCYLIVRFHKYSRVLRSITSYLFASFLYELMQAGIDTANAFTLMQTVEKNSILFPCVQEVKRLLESGFSYEEIIMSSDYFSAVFQKYFLIGYRASILTQTLQLFMAQELQTWKRYLHVGGIVLQLFIYIIIGLLVYSVYQLLLMPLEMLNQM